MKDKIWVHPNYIETPQKIKDFYKEYCELCRKHNISLSHEDGHGAFIIDETDLEHNLEWVAEAYYEPKLENEIKIEFNFD